MASNSSGTLSPSQTYTLGDYVFRLITQYISSEDITTVQCNATHGTDHAQSGVDLSGTATISKWRVEAEDKTATAYATRHYEQPSISPIKRPFVFATTGERKMQSGHEYTYEFSSGSGYITFVWLNNMSFDYIFVSESPGAVVLQKSGETIISTYNLDITYTYSGKTVYLRCGSWGTQGDYITKLVPICNDEYSVPSLSGDIMRRVAWVMIYGDLADEEHLVSRFEINIADAGGGSWDDPGSTGDVSKTLNVTVTGALSGRHNDPLNDTSYAYTPADQDAATVYGSGGDGGHGGGGGAGASTVVIHTIATERAGNVDETAIAKRHGYGSGGGKGGKGADGCILVYY